MAALRIRLRFRFLFVPVRTRRALTSVTARRHSVIALPGSCRDASSDGYCHGWRRHRAAARRSSVNGHRSARSVVSAWFPASRRQPVKATPAVTAHAVGGSLQASGDLERLFPNKQAQVPDGDEPEPSSDAEDNFEDAAFEETPAQALRRVEAEHRVAADAAGRLGVPTQRPTRVAAAAANQAMDAMHARGELQ